jgi:hypothetical protein
MGSLRALMMRRAFRSLGAILLAAGLLFALPEFAQGQITPGEPRLKAASMRKILRFVKWPPGAFPAKGDTFQFCVAGDHLLGFALAQELRTITIDGRKVEVRWVQKGNDLKGCHALFVSPSEENRLMKVLQSVNAANALDEAFSKACKIPVVIHQHRGGVVH